MGRTIESFRGPARGMWAAQPELLSPMEGNEELRTFLAKVQRVAAGGLAELFLGIDPARDPEAARTAGPVLHALFIGVIVKWFMDPEQALSAREITEGLRIITEQMTGAGHGTPEPPPGTAQAGPAGMVTSSEVPPPGGLVISIRPPTAATRSLRPMSPEPRDGSAPPAPSSATSSRRVPPATPASTRTTEARACLAAFASASDTT
jgi:hypothetical protein